MSAVEGWALVTYQGAREYSPGMGSSISPDPLLDPADPQDLNPYAYASDNPSTLSDPSGQMSLLPGPGGGGGEGCKSYGIDCWSSNGNGGNNGNGNGSRGSDLGSAGGLGSGGGGCGYIGCGVFLPGAAQSRTERLVQALLQPVLMPGPKPARKVITNGSPAGDTCSIATLRFDPSFACKVTPAQPNSGHSFNPFSWIGTATHWDRSNLNWLVRGLVWAGWVMLVLVGAVERSC
jgi:RHS repeat-associated protein